ncbi:zinc-binding domain-containing protein [Hirsutella rhossiliensis]|uniref:Zinc-binding domain-containing protein n=1 Tax=Hirsutella rhossiliensis TaxID=111463 RepID=A0A9P8MMQ8_9HYPO|nr:zinc-binding domain-containing protein [Hirsutella rhossiliensis]KAH0958208.1 zinc-binding domain-containing protein [Hirsutella rhossiliensis]
MARKKSRPAKKWSLYPGCHGQVSSLLAQEDLFFDFNDDDDDKTCMKSYDTKIMCRFVCRNRACTAERYGWESTKIAITLRMYRGATYNARVYSQRCKHYNLVSSPILDDSYSERVANRIKTWCGVKLNLTSRKGEGKGHHIRRACEGCRDGHCRESEDRAT